MKKFLSDEQRDRLFRKLIVSASDILADEFGLPRRSFEEIKEMIEKRREGIDGDDMRVD